MSIHLSILSLSHTLSVDSNINPTYSSFKNGSQRWSPEFQRASSFSHFSVDEPERQIEYYFASDARSVASQARSSFTSFPLTHSLSLHSNCMLLFLIFCSAIIEHTNRVIFLEDDDVAAVSKDGCKLECFCLFFLCILWHWFAP